MKLTRDEIIKLARLSSLHLTEDEIISYQDELGVILDYVKQLDSVNVEGLLPTYQVTGLTSADSNATRDDVPGVQVSQSALLRNVPKTENGLIKVKRMIG